MPRTCNRWDYPLVVRRAGIVEAGDSGGQPLAPRIFIQTDSNLVSESNERLAEHPRFFGQPLQPPVIGMHRSLQPEVKEPSGLAVDQAGHPETFREATQFAQCWCPLLEVDEMGHDAALRKEPERLTSVCTLPGPKDLHLRLRTSRASHCFPRWMVTLFPPTHRHPHGCEGRS